MIMHILRYWYGWALWQLARPNWWLSHELINGRLAWHTLPWIGYYAHHEGPWWQELERERRANQ
jgi:hypothetical protein